jgi:glycosyltransferase involved in cell wall biosynthesis
VYNGAEYLAETLDSLRAQTFADCEIVISDNASSDGTAEICRRYAARDSRIRYSRNEVNVGANRNFNRVVALATAPYFKLANADDLCAPDLIRRCVEVLDRHPEVVLCYARTRFIDRQGRFLEDYDDNLDLRWESPVERFKAAVGRTRFVNALSGVVQTAVLRKTVLLGSYPGADVVLLGDLALRGQFQEIPDRLFFRRMHPAASSSLAVQEKQAFVDPGVPGGVSLRFCKMHLAYLSMFRRAPLSLRDRATLLLWGLRSARWTRDLIGSELLELGRWYLRRLVGDARSA